MAPGPVVPTQTPSRPGVGKAGGHEGGGLFVPHWHKADAIPALTQSFDDRIDAVADDAEDVRRAPIDERLDQDIRGILVAVRERRRLRRYGVCGPGG